MRRSKDDMACFRVVRTSAWGVKFLSQDGVWVERESAKTLFPDSKAVDEVINHFGIEGFYQYDCVPGSLARSIIKSSWLFDRQVGWVE